MIRVIIERHAKNRENLPHLLRELRAAIVHQPGYVSGETLINTEDDSNIVVISTWEDLETWKAWTSSETRAKLYQQVALLLKEPPKVTTYRIAAAEERRL